MKKACYITKKFFFSLFIACLIFFNVSCGLDTFIVMGDPVATIYVPEYSSLQFNNNYFEFWTKEEDVYPSDFQYLGVDIYYKIYSSSETLLSERGSLESLANSSDSSSKAPEKLINPVSSGGFGYQKLMSTNYNNSPLIQTIGRNQKVYIRLTDYQDSVNLEFASKILVDNGNLGASTSITKPIRAFEGKTFNFGRTGSNDKKPVISDEDVKGTTEPADNKWYVCMFAVGVGIDVSYKNHFSNIVYLGSVPIDANEIDN